MNRKWGWFSAVVTIVACFLVAAPQAGVCLAQEKEKAEEKEEESGYVRFEEERPMGTVEPGKALVYAVRPARVGFAVKSFFLCDDEILGINKGRSYFFAQVAPGKHVFWSKAENVDALELTVEAGKTYYLQQHVQMGFGRARTKLEVLDEKEGKAALDKCNKRSVMTEKGIEMGKEYVRDHKKDTQEDLDRRAREESERQAKEKEK
jgi:hypothetical protein